ncbi:hypothetical protein YN1_0970 [Nanoarchaeota archaeon]
MPYEIEYEFEIPISVIKDILENYNSSINIEDIINKDENLIKRLLLNYIINKYLSNDVLFLDEKEFDDIIKNMKVEIRKKYFYVRLLL